MKGIKRRWFQNYVLVLLIIIIILGSIFMFAFKNFLYNNVYNLLSNRGRLAVEFYEKYYNTSLYTPDEIAQMMIDRYDWSKLVELQILDLEGNIIQSTSGFPLKVTDYMPSEATEENSKLVYHHSQTKEKVMGVFIPLKNKTGETILVLKYITSLDKVDSILYKVFILSIGVLGVFIFIISILSFVFTRTIIDPIEKIIKASDKLAQGNYNARINIDFKDELKVLADSINSMAGEIQASEKLKNEFISSVTHEIRTPLTSIKGWGETILTSDFKNEKEVKQGLNIIVKETERLSYMVEELLEFSKIEAGNFKIYTEACDLVEIVEDVLSIYKGKFTSKKITPVFEHFQDRLIMTLDSNRIRQVIINILENSYKYSDYNSKIVLKLTEKNDKIVLTIKDYGKGISPENLEKVKDKFFKGSSKKAGSGLGLAISNEIMKLHGGSLTIDSILNKETTVTLEFPKRKE